MKNIIKICVFGVLLLSVCLAKAQSPKFGHIDLQALIQVMPERAVAEKQFNAYQKQLESVAFQGSDLLKRSDPFTLKTEKAINKIDSLSESLPDPNITKMKGDNPFHRIRVGDYRIVYEIRVDILLILILKIGHRKDIYRKLS